MFIREDFSVKEKIISGGRLKDDQLQRITYRNQLRFVKKMISLLQGQLRR